MKKFTIVCLLFMAGSLWAQTGMFVGMGVETNAYTREGATLGGGLSSALDLNKWFSVGVKVGFFADFDTVNTLETAAIVRYYLPLPISGFFLQAELGGAFFFEDNESYPAFLGGLAAGWRYYVKNKWYIEPSVRGGYPFIWGVGFHAGTSIDL